jgi:hypothetical protein
MALLCASTGPELSDKAAIMVTPNTMLSKPVIVDFVGL